MNKKLLKNKEWCINSFKTNRGRLIKSKQGGRENL